MSSADPNPAMDSQKGVENNDPGLKVPTINLFHHVHSALKTLDRVVKNTVGSYTKEDTPSADLEHLKRNMAPYRKKLIKDAACYNCVEPHYELLHCMRKGSWFDQFNGCYEQNKKYSACVKKQQVYN
jgi:hypothetical protein